LMIPGSKLTDIWGRKFCFLLGLAIYGTGAVIAAASNSLPLLIPGYSFFEGVGSALMIPPIYIMVTVAFSDIPSRARAFGIVSAAAGIGAAAGPLIGGLITTAISWRASFIAQALVVAGIFVISFRMAVPGNPPEKPRFDLLGAVLSAGGLFLIVLGVLQSRTYGWLASRQDFSIGNTVIISKGGVSPVWIFVAAGALVLLWFFVHIRRRERAGKEPLLATKLFRSRVSNLGLVTQNIQWLTMQGAFFVISVYLQKVQGLNAIETGLALTPAIVGMLASSLIAERLAKRFPQRTLIWSGFVLSTAGMILILLFGRATSAVAASIPGLLLMGIGIGAMLTPSVNVVQSAFPEKDQGEISGLSRSISNLGSSLGTAIAGSVLVSSLVPGNRLYGFALATIAGFGLIGLAAAILLPRRPART
jgi:MFS family permease